KEDVALFDNLQPDTSASAIIAGAMVRIFDTQQVAFLGYIFSDGHFGLLSRVNVEPLKLSVAGISAELPVAIQGRLMLQGLVRGSQSEAQIAAQIYAEWPVIPTIAHIQIGSKSRPVSFQLNSRGQFSIVGSGVLNLFNGNSRLKGTFDISHTHCHLSGEFSYASLTVLNGEPLLDIKLDTVGRIGPGQQFSLSGNGSLSIMGQPFTSVRGELNERGTMFSAMIDTDTWRPFGLPLGRFYLAAKGEIDISQRRWPKINLEGECQLNLFGDQGISLSGRGGFKTDSRKLILYAEGQLKWLGREWLNGRIELGTRGIALSGRTAFTLPLIGIPDRLQDKLGSLFLNLELSGQIEMDALGRLRTCVLKGHWLLAVKMPNAGEQVVPIAMQALDIDYRPRRLMNSATIMPLVTIDRLNLIPVDGVSLPIPTITASDTQALYLTFTPLELSSSIRAPHIVSGSSSAADYTVPSGWTATTENRNVVDYVRRAINSWTPGTNLDIPKPNPMPTVNMPVPKFRVNNKIGIEIEHEYPINITSPLDMPQLTLSKPDKTAEPLLEVPTEFMLDWEEADLGTIIDQLNFSLALGWENGSPGINVQYGRESQFISF
ncbi:MAG: hypothetical protein KDE51_24535, partial [Anaerolineales bacterium]|nr:hypothetical protein [Anaerolineales bacterium]